MYHNFVPIKLHNDAEALMADLRALTEQPTICPYCQHSELYAVNQSAGYYRCKSCKRSFNRSLNTPFYRLAPLAWLEVIASRRLAGQSFNTIRHELGDCTTWVIKRRVQIIDVYMQLNYPALYQWYCTFVDNSNSDEPTIITQQVAQLKAWINQILQATTAICPYCGSNKVLKVGETRARFRCKSCWRYFSHLKGTGLEHLGNSENWFSMIDMLIAGATNREIEQKLKISSSTITHAKRNWLTIMQQQDLLILKEWLINKKGR